MNEVLDTGKSVVTVLAGLLVTIGGGIVALALVLNLLKGALL